MGSFKEMSKVDLRKWENYLNTEKCYRLGAGHSTNSVDNDLQELRKHI